MKTPIDDIAPYLTPSSEDQNAEVKTMPHNLEAEQSLLGAILINNDIIDKVSGFLKPEHFYEPLHARIYDISSQLIQAGKRATPITLKTFFEDGAEDSESNGSTNLKDYLISLVSGATTTINVQDYGQIIFDMHQRRSLIQIGEEMVYEAFQPELENPPSEQIEATERKLYTLAETGKYGQGFEDFASALKGAVEMAASAHQRSGGLSGISSGLKNLDDYMGGLQSSDLIILAGRPSMGKTALATNIAFNIANAYKTEKQADGTQKSVDGAIVGFFSLEMSSEQLATRILAEQAEISSRDIRRGKITSEQFDRLVATSRRLQQLPLYIDQTGGISIAQLAARARRLKRQHGLGLLIVDYLQLLSGSKNSQANRVQEITEITTGLKALAKELNVPILALSQLSRQVEAREDKRPQLSDLRESGSIEQDADVVLFVYREEYYVERAQPREGTPEHETWQDEMAKVMGLAEVIIGKQRHGATGTAKLAFIPDYTKFADFIPDSHLPERMD